MKISLLKPSLLLLFIMSALQGHGQDGEGKSVTASLRGISAIDGQVCWASGSSGTVLLTTDGGEHWESVGPVDAEKLDFRDIEAFSAKEAVILSAGQPARAYRTVDGGRSWKMTFSTDLEGAFFDGMDFWEDQGVAFSDPVDGKWLIIGTLDRGKSWRVIPPEESPDAKVGQAGFAASGRGVVMMKDHFLFGTGGSAAEVYRFDSLAQWNISPIPFMRVGNGCGIFALEIEGDMGVAVGGCYLDSSSREGVAAYSEDGGTSWLPVTGNPPNGYRSAVTYSAKAKSFFAVGRTGIDRSSDGNTWEKVSDEGHYTADAKGDFLWLAGRGGKLKRMKVK